MEPKLMMEYNNKKYIFILKKVNHEKGDCKRCDLDKFEGCDISDYCPLSGGYWKEVKEEKGETKC